MLWDAYGSGTNAAMQKTSLAHGADVKPSLCSLTARQKTARPLPGTQAALVLPDLTAKQDWGFSQH